VNFHKDHLVEETLLLVVAVRSRHVVVGVIAQVAVVRE
jgi:hypothetical protein